MKNYTKTKYNTNRIFEADDAQAQGGTDDNKKVSAQISEFVIGYYKTVKEYLAKASQKLPDDVTTALTEPFQTFNKTVDAIKPDKPETVQAAGNALTEFFKAVNAISEKLSNNQQKQNQQQNLNESFGNILQSNLDKMNCYKFLRNYNG